MKQTGSQPSITHGNHYLESIHYLRYRQLYHEGHSPAFGGQCVLSLVAAFIVVAQGPYRAGKQRFNKTEYSEVTDSAISLLASQSEDLLRASYQARPSQEAFNRSSRIYRSPHFQAQIHYDIHTAAQLFSVFITQFTV